MKQIQNGYRLRGNVESRGKERGGLFRHVLFWWVLQWFYSWRLPKNWNKVSNNGFVQIQKTFSKRHTSLRFGLFSLIEALFWLALTLLERRRWRDSNSIAGECNNRDGYSPKKKQQQQQQRRVIRSEHNFRGKIYLITWLFNLLWMWMFIKGIIKLKIKIF